MIEQTQRNYMNKQTFTIYLLLPLRNNTTNTYQTCALYQTREKKLKRNITVKICLSPHDNSFRNLA